MYRIHVVVPVGRRQVGPAPHAPPLLHHRQGDRDVAPLDCRLDDALLLRQPCARDSGATSHTFRASRCANLQIKWMHIPTLLTSCSECSGEPCDVPKLVPELVPEEVQHVR